MTDLRRAQGPAARGAVPAHHHHRNPSKDIVS